MMNDYFHKHAYKNDQASISKCTVVLRDNDLVGYLCWNNAAVVKTGLDPADARGLPGYPMPAILISRLAVDVRFQRRGIAAEMLRWIFERCLDIADNPVAPAFRFVFVDAIDGNAKQFYQKYGFKPFIDKPMSLYISLDTIRAAGV
jgi:GNAT superfamily N-acetyltransferase